MWIKHLEIGLCVIDFIFCLNRIQQRLKLNQSTVFLFYEDDFSNFAEITENVVNAVIIKVFR